MSGSNAIGTEEGRGGGIADGAVTGVGGVVVGEEGDGVHVGGIPRGVEGGGEGLGMTTVGVVVGRAPCTGEGGTHDVVVDVVLVLLAGGEHLSLAYGGGDDAVLGEPHIEAAVGTGKYAELLSGDVNGKLARGSVVMGSEGEPDEGGHGGLMGVDVQECLHITGAYEGREGGGGVVEAIKVGAVEHNAGGPGGAVLIVEPDEGLVGIGGEVVGAEAGVMVHAHDIGEGTEGFGLALVGYGAVGALHGSETFYEDVAVKISVKDIDEGGGSVVGGVGVVNAGGDDGEGEGVGSFLVTEDVLREGLALLCREGSIKGGAADFGALLAPHDVEA